MKSMSPLVQLVFIVTICTVACADHHLKSSEHDITKLTHHSSNAPVLHHVTTDKHHKSKYPKKHVQERNVEYTLKEHETGHQNSKHSGDNVHHQDAAKKGQLGHDKHDKKYRELVGKKAIHHEQSQHADQKHTVDNGKHSAKFADGKKMKKTNFLKAYHEKYHKDEHKKHDEFYSTKEKKGEYEKFGAANSRKHSHHHDKTETGKYKSGKFSDKHGKESKYEKKNSKADHLIKNGGHGKEFFYAKANKWAKKNHHNHEKQ